MEELFLSMELHLKEIERGRGGGLRPDYTVLSISKYRLVFIVIFNALGEIFFEREFFDILLHIC